MMLILPLFYWMLRALLMSSASLSIFLLSGLVAQKRCSPYPCCELLVEQLCFDDVGFASVVMDVERTVDVERLDVHFLVVRSVLRKVVVHIFDANFVGKHFSLLLLVVALPIPDAVGSSTAS